MSNGEANNRLTGYVILHDAIKIGLGAFIGIAGTIWVTRMSNQHAIEVLKQQHAFDRETAFIDIRRKKIEQASAELNAFNTAYADYRTTIHKAARETGMDSVTDILMQSIKEKERNFSEAFKRLNDAAGHLKLVEAGASYISFSSYAETAEEFFRECHPHNTTLTADEINQWREKMASARNSLLDSLGQDFKNLTP